MKKELKSTHNFKKSKSICTRQTCIKSKGLKQEFEISNKHIHHY